jgi:hypothetical protein
MGILIMNKRSYIPPLIGEDMVVKRTVELDE